MLRLFQFIVSISIDSLFSARVISVGLSVKDSIGGFPGITKGRFDGMEAIFRKDLWSRGGLNSCVTSSILVGVLDLRRVSTLSITL